MQAWLRGFVVGSLADINHVFVGCKIEIVAPLMLAYERAGEKCKRKKNANAEKWNIAAHYIVFCSARTDTSEWKPVGFFFFFHRFFQNCYVWPMTGGPSSSPVQLLHYAYDNLYFICIFVQNIFVSEFYKTKPGKSQVTMAIRRSAQIEQIKPTCRCDGIRWPKMGFEQKITSRKQINY